MFQSTLLSSSGFQDCVCCSFESIEQQSNKLFTRDSHCFLPQKSSLVCKLCNRRQNLDCVEQFLHRMKTNLSKSALLNDQWYQFCSSIDFNIHQQVINIPKGICCDFKPSLTECSIPKPKPPPQSSIVEDLCTSIDDILLNEEMCHDVSSSEDEVETKLQTSRSSTSIRKDDVRSFKSHWSHNEHISGDPLKFLSKYHDANCPHRTKPFKGGWNKLRNAVHADFGRKKPELLMNNRYAGALYFPSHQLLIQSQACNSFLYTDIHAVAKSDHDHSLGVPHAVISDRNSNMLVNYVITNKQKTVCARFPPHLHSRFDVNIITLQDVPSPEDPDKTRNLIIQVLTVTQKEKLSETILRKGMKYFPPEELVWSSFFGYQHVHQHADVTMILGDLSLETHNIPKLLLLRFHSMIHHKIADEEATVLCNSLRCVAGKHGYELNRVVGSSGRRTLESDHDFLRVMNEVPSALPRKCGACKIVPFRLGYRIFYKKLRPKEGKHPIAYTTYSVPTPGGSFSMKNETMIKYPHVGEMAYLKMTAACIIQKYNSVFKEEISKGPLASEFQHINICRHQYKNEGNYYRFISFYNTFNSYSAVFTNVGIHNDHFSKRKESLENKCLFEDWNYDRCLGTKGCGSGGTFIKRDNKCSVVVAILDWNNVTRAKRGFVQVNHVEIGCDPNARLTKNLEQQIMESSVAEQYTRTVAIAQSDEGQEGTQDVDAVARGHSVEGGDVSAIPIMHATRDATDVITNNIDNLVSNFIDEAAGENTDMNNSLHDNNLPKKQLSHPVRGQFSKDYGKNLRIENDKKERQRVHQEIIERANPEYRRRMETQRREDDRLHRELLEQINRRRKELAEEQSKKNNKK